MGAAHSKPFKQSFLRQPTLKPVALIVALCLALPFIDGAEAETWRWRDAEGNLNFGDTPPEGVAAETVRVTPTRPKLSPQEADAAVRHLREEAQVQSREAEAGRRAAAQRAAADSEAAQRTSDRCEEAKRALTMLRMERPVYEDDQGGYRIKRPPGQGDSYTGGRHYLDDASRAAAIEAQEAIIAETCKVPWSGAEELRVADALREREACENAAAELAEGDAEGLRLAPEDRARLERFLREECGPP
ncbi:MAG: DUF4124 domain-containing protein [Gammaproteobacteria bacterium]|nr:DUF4124 domain-containing protein [Gammaproteobacteria bacterium]